VAIAKADEDAAFVLSIPGVGMLIASAFTAAIGQAESFAKGRDLAPWFELVPRQSTTAGKSKLLGGSASEGTNICASC
jgi:transposase